MKRVAVVYADSVDSPSGLPSRIYEEIGGESIIRRLLRAVSVHEGLDKVIAITRKEGDERLQQECEGLDVTVRAIKWNDVSYRDALRRARKWSSGNWRGGLWGTTTYDEEGDPRLLQRILQEEKADRVIKISGHTPFFDAALLSDMMTSEENTQPELNVYLAQLPPGFSYEFWWGNTLRQFAEHEVTLRNVFRYAPKSSKRDPITFRCLYGIEIKHLEHPFRFLADSQRGLDCMRDLHNRFGDEVFTWGFEKISDLHLQDRMSFLGRFPKEMEIELTTRQSVRSVLRPCPARAKTAVDMPFEKFQSIIDSLAEYDDVLITYGGHGDPLLHPEFLRCVEYAHEKGVYGQHAVTPGLDISKELAEQIALSELDALTLVIDAADDEQYKDVWGQEGIKTVLKNIMEMHQHKVKKGKFHPHIVADFVKSKRSFNSMEPFFDKWFFEHKVDVVIRGFNDYSGQVESDSMATLTLMPRRLCESLQHRMTVLADGRVPICGQDFEGLHSIGNAFETPLGELWMHDTMQALRVAHGKGRFDTSPLCGPCNDWDHL